MMDRAKGDRVPQLFRSAVDLSTEERVRYLGDSCAGDAALLETSEATIQRDRRAPSRPRADRPRERAWTLRTPLSRSSTLAASRPAAKAWLAQELRRV
jgi:hypothetical protein